MHDPSGRYILNVKAIINPSGDDKDEKLRSRSKKVY